jgi:hypothetical protein
VFVLLIAFVVLVGCQGKNIKFSEKLMKTIDDNCELNESCNILVKDITSFNWDRMVIFGVGCDEDDISEALGVEYKWVLDCEY